MPDTIPNPYSSRFAPALSGLARAFMSGPSDAQNIYTAERALQEKRKREGHERLSAGVRNIGTPGYDMRGTLADAFSAGIDPSQLGTAQRVYNANTYGAADPRTDNAVVGAGGGFGSTADAFKQTQAGLDRRHTETVGEQRRQFDSQPQTVGTPSGPQIVRRSESYGQPAVEDLGKVKGDYARRAINQPNGINNLTPTEKTFVGANDEKVRTPHNYIPQAGGAMMQTFDGITDARTGQPLPPGAIASVQGTPEQSGLSKTVQSQLQGSNVALDRMKGVADYARSLIVPQNVGIPGMVKGAAQDIVQVADGLAKGLGIKSAEDIVANIQQRVQSGGIDSNTANNLFTFDPRLPQVSSAYHALTLTAADAIAGGVGKASNHDIKMVTGILGNPESLFANEGQLHAKLDALNAIADRMHGVNQSALRGPAVPAGPAQAAPGASPPPSPAPGAPPAVIQYDAAGNRVQ